MARNPIFAQLERKAKLKAEQAGKPAPAAPKPPAPPSAPTPPPPPTPTATPLALGEGPATTAKDLLETLPDEDLKAKGLLALDDYDPAWDRATLIDKLIAAGVAG